MKDGVGYIDVLLGIFNPVSDDGGGVLFGGCGDGGRGQYDQSHLLVGVSRLCLSYQTQQNSPLGRYVCSGFPRLSSMAKVETWRGCDRAVAKFMYVSRVRGCWCAGVFMGDDPRESRSQVIYSHFYFY